MKRAGLLICVVLVVFATQPVSQSYGQGDVNFTRLVNVGDSLTAGFQDGALHAEGQSTGFTLHIAAAMGTDISVPLIGEPGIPTPNPATGSGLLVKIPGTCQVGATTFAQGTTNGRLDPLTPATNVGVPGADMNSAFTSKWSIDPQNPVATADTVEDFVLGFPYAFLPPPANTPRTQIETAIGLQPTFLTVWLGSNDALAAALAATVNDQTLTPVADFNMQAESVFAALATTGADGVVGNVPDVTVIANLFSSTDLQALTGLDAAQVNLLFGVKKTSYVPLSALPTVLAIGNGQLPPRSLTPNQILTKKEIKKIRKATKKFNKKLEALAKANGWAYVDINAALTEYDKSGYTIPGFGTLTTDYLGGVFSLDGVHPTATAHAVVASLFIRAINEHYGTSLAEPDVAAVAMNDPLVCRVNGKASEPLTLEDVVLAAPAARGAESVILRRQ